MAFLYYDLFLKAASFGASCWLCFVIVVYPPYLYYYFSFPESVGCSAVYWQCMFHIISCFCSSRGLFVINLINMTFPGYFRLFLAVSAGNKNSLYLIVNEAHQGNRAIIAYADNNVSSEPEHLCSNS